MKGSEAEMVKILLSEEALRITGRYLEKMFVERKDLLYAQDRDNSDEE